MEITNAFNFLVTNVCVVSFLPLPDALFTYWSKASAAELMDFFTLIEYDLWFW